MRVGDLAVTDVARHDIEAFIEVHRTPRIVTFADAKGRTHEWRRGGVVAVNRCLGRLRAVFNWAIEMGYAETSPFKRGTTTVVRLFKESERERRLLPGEEERLLAAANAHLQALITAALETGCRVGEFLSLQWHQVRWDPNEIHLPAAKTKTRRQRDLPMSQWLRALLEMRRHGPDGREYPPNAYVFGDVTGRRVKSIKTAWENTKLKAYECEPKREKNGRLTPDCRRKLAEINLNFRDLRRESGSSKLEGGMPLNIIQAFLGHANISTTSRYLKVTRQGMHAALKQFEANRDARGNLVAKSADAPDQPESAQARKSVQQSSLRGGRYWTRTSDLVRVKHAL